MKIPALFILLLSILPIPAHAQSHSPSPRKGVDVSLIRLWMSQDDVRAQWGSPKMFFVPRAQRMISVNEYNAAVETWGMVADVFERKTASNEYQIKVFYGLDSSTSRLHPTFRVDRVDFEVDRPAPIQSISRDIAEVLDLCSKSCHAFGHEFAHEMEAVAYIAHPSEQELTEARCAAGDCATSSRWMAAAKFSWEQKSRSEKPTPEEWMAHPIEKVSLSVVDPEFEAKMSRSTNFLWMVDLGELVVDPQQKALDVSRR